MESESEHLAAAKRIHAAINSRPPGWDEFLRFARHPRWVGPLVSSIVLALGEEDVTVVSLGEADGQRPNGSGDSRLKAVVGGDTLVVEAVVVAHAGDDRAEFTVTARSLRSVQELEIKTDVPPLNDGSTWYEWPGRPEVVLRFGRGEMVSLPLSPIRLGEDQAAYLELVRRLPSFLGGGHHRGVE